MSWEYWNGLGWASIIDVQSVECNEYDDEKKNIDIFLFTCPEDIKPVLVAGNEKYWIRIRITSGDYGKVKQKATTEPDGDIIWSEIADDIRYPVLGRLDNDKNIKIIDIQVDCPPLTAEQCLSFNNLEYVKRKLAHQGTPFPLFVGLPDGHPTLYFGFDDKIENGPFNLLFSLNEEKSLTIQEATKFDFMYTTSDRGTDTINDTGKEPVLLQKPLAVLDETMNITKSGRMRFSFPPDTQTTPIFGKDLFWIKLVDTLDAFASPMTGTVPHEIRNVYTNTVTAINATRINDEILGSSSGLPNQTFKLANNVTQLDNFEEHVYVNETSHIKEGEKNALAELGQVQEIINPGDNLEQVWVLWRRVKDIFAMGPDDRCFTLDSALGIIRFGNGINGMIPSRGSIIKVDYMSGGGDANVNANEIKTLKTLVPFVDSVINHEPAMGGFDGETLEDALSRVPQFLRHRNQAITAADYESIVKEKFSLLANVKCMSTTNNSGSFESGWTTVVVIQHSKDAKPVPSSSLLANVEQHLAKCCSNILVSAKQFKVIPPLYIKTSVFADVYVSPMVQDSLEDKVLKALSDFFHPLTGGFDGKGWDFGYVVSPSDLYRFFNSISEIDHVGNLWIQLEIEDGGYNRQGENEATESTVSRLSP